MCHSSIILCKRITGTFRCERLLFRCPSGELTTTVPRDVGFLRYFTLNQVPLFVLSAPVLALSFVATYAFFSSNWRFIWAHLRGHRPSMRAERPALHVALTPHYILHTILSFLLLFASHVQICLRLAATNPVIFWWAADLVQADSASKTRQKWGRRWLHYSIIWGSIALVLWAGFYPPA